MKKKVYEAIAPICLYGSTYIPKGAVFLVVKRPRKQIQLYLHDFHHKIVGIKEIDLIIDKKDFKKLFRKVKNV